LYENWRFNHRWAQMKHRWGGGAEIRKEGSSRPGFIEAFHVAGGKQSAHLRDGNLVECVQPFRW